MRLRDFVTACRDDAKGRFQGTDAPGADIPTPQIPVPPVQGVHGPTRRCAALNHKAGALDSGRETREGRRPTTTHGEVRRGGPPPPMPFRQLPELAGATRRLDRCSVVHLIVLAMLRRALGVATPPSTHSKSGIGRRGHGRREEMRVEPCQSTKAGASPARGALGDQATRATHADCHAVRNHSGHEKTGGEI